MKYKNQPDVVSWLSLVLAFLLLPLSACTKSREQPLNTPPPPPRQLYLKSQKELLRGGYERAYDDYQKAVTDDPSLANVSHLSSILYTWAISQSEAEDVPLLTAQKQVMLTPKQFAPRAELLSVAVDKEKEMIYAFGIGLAPQQISQPVQARLLAREAALSDAYVWVARLAMWTKMGVEGPFDVSRTVVGVQMIKESWIRDTIYIVKVEAPLNNTISE